MKRISIPRIDSLDSLSAPEAISDLLDSKGVVGEINSLNWPDIFPSAPEASFVMAHSGHNLYIDFHVRANAILAKYDKDQSPVSEDSCVEVFLQPKEGGEYWNFEFNCIGALYASHRMTRPNPTRFVAEELASVRRYPSMERVTFEEKSGDFAWHLLVVIPLSLMGIDSPSSGTVIRGNLYACASRATTPYYLSWNPITTEKPDFHRPEFFGELILE